MRYLITVFIAALSLNAFGQGIPQLPYNPDENGDGLIGVPDLQALLSQYGLEFNSAVLSEDAQSAIVYMGEMAHPVCNLACDNLPGFWHMSTMDDLALVWDEVISSSYTWINFPKEVTFKDGLARLYAYHTFSGPSGVHEITWLPINTYRCYCAAHELPKVEYSYCYGGTPDSESFVGCINEKLSEGWYPLSGWPLARDKQGYTGNSGQVAGSGYNPQTHASFWRWAVE
jgi:hypothetical protein